MGRRVSWVPALVVAAALLVGISGCDTNPAPGPLTPGALPSDPAPSTGRLWQSTPPTAPAMPVAARGTGPRAAKAFVRHYVALVNYASKTGEVGLLRSAGAPGCHSCRSVEQRIKRVYAAGGNIRSNGWKITDLSVVRGVSRRGVRVDAALRLPAQTVLVRPGATPHRFSGGRLPVTFKLVSRNNVWQVAEWERAA